MALDVKEMKLKELSNMIESEKGVEAAGNIISKLIISK